MDMAGQTNLGDDDRRKLWKECLARPVREQVELADDLLQMTSSPLGSSDPSDWTLLELFQHPCPPIPWLNGVARFAKRSHRDGSLDPAIAQAIYQVVMAEALVRRKTHLTLMSDSVLQAGFETALAYSWLDGDSRWLLDQAIAIIKPPTREG
jgi:hypothetical protein